MSPETLLKCARKAYPQYEWAHDVFLGVCRSQKGSPVASNHVAYTPSTVTFRLDIETYDQMALQIALEKEGWQFWALNDGFYAGQAEPLTELKAATKPELLAQCVEASQ